MEDLLGDFDAEGVRIYVVVLGSWLLGVEERFEEVFYLIIDLLDILLYAADHSLLGYCLDQTRLIVH